MDLELQFGFDENRGARENGIVINKAEKGFIVIVTGEKGFISREKLFTTADEAYSYAISLLRYHKDVVMKMNNNKNSTDFEDR